MILDSLAAGLKQRDWGKVLLEIMIVVVGIFIGLQVDDWNRSRIDRADIAEYLQRIQKDLQRDADFYSFLADEARYKRDGLAALKRILGKDSLPAEDPHSFFELVEDTSSIGWEFPEVQNVTFLDLQSSGKLALIRDAELRGKLSFFYQESPHRSDRIQSRITGYAAALYEITDLRARLVGRDDEFRDEIIDEDVELRAVVESFLLAAQEDRFLKLLTAEQNYTEFVIAQVKIQLTEIKNLQLAVSDATGITAH
jgi:hypothetical protein